MTLLLLEINLRTQLERFNLLNDIFLTEKKI